MEDNRDRMTDRLEVEVRRSPKYSMFIIAGVVVGFIVAGVLAALPVDTSDLGADYSTAGVMGLLMVILGTVGATLGAVVALIIDRRNLKRARTYTVNAEYVARRRTEAQRAEAEAKAAEAAAADSSAAVTAAPAPTAAEANAAEAKVAEQAGAAAALAEVPEAGVAEVAAQSDTAAQSHDTTASKAKAQPAQNAPGEQDDSSPWARG